METNELKQKTTVEDLLNTNEQLTQSLRDALIGVEQFRKEAEKERERANMLEVRLSMADDRIKREVIDNDEISSLQRLCKGVNKYNVQKLLELFVYDDPRSWCEQIAKISMIISDLITRKVLDDDEVIYPTDYANAFFYLKMLYETFLSMDKHTPKSFDVQFLLTTQCGESIIQ